MCENVCVCARACMRMRVSKFFFLVTLRPVYKSACVNNEELNYIYTAKNHLHGQKSVKRSAFLPLFHYTASGISSARCSVNKEGAKRNKLLTRSNIFNTLRVE